MGALGVGLVFEHGASVARVSHGKPSITVGVEGAQVVGGLEGADGTPLAVFAGVFLLVVLCMWMYCHGVVCGV